MNIINISPKIPKESNKIESSESLNFINYPKSKPTNKIESNHSLFYTSQLKQQIIKPNSIIYEHNFEIVNKKLSRHIYMDLQTLNKKSKNKSQNMIVTHQGESRIFTKRMLLEIINDIYESKKYSDICSVENKMPYETMEQHLYSYLNYKYGLRVI